MPVILRVKGYRCWFYEADLSEPVHVHVGKGGKEAKFWMNPISIARAGRFRENELREIQRILSEFRGNILAAWQRELAKRENR